jgi:hypothetical protein
MSCQSVRSFVAKQQNVLASSVVISSVEVHDGASISYASASNMTAPDLIAQHPVVIVKLPEGSTPAWEQRVSALERDNAELWTCLQRMQRRSSAIALRALLDAVRTKVNEGVPLQDSEKLAWNARVTNMPDAELAQRGLTRQQLQLTMYGANTLQHQGTKAVHEVDLQEVAEAVTARSNDHRALFKYAYRSDPEEHVFPDTA